MTQLDEHLGSVAQVFMVAYAIIALTAVIGLWQLSVRWRQHGVDTRARARALVALALVTAVALAVVGLGQDYFQRQADRQRLQVELQERERIAADVRIRIHHQIDAVRALLADRTVRNIESNTLTAARADLARFAALKDPRINQMLALIDTELEIRALVAHSLQATDPATLARVYARLSELVPDNQNYRKKANQFAASAAKEAP